MRYLMGLIGLFLLGGTMLEASSFSRRKYDPRATMVMADSYAALKSGWVTSPSVQKPQATADWSQMPEPALRCLAGHLGPKKNLCAAATVCKNWRSVLSATGEYNGMYQCALKRRLAHHDRVWFQKIRDGQDLNQGQETRSRMRRVLDCVENVFDCFGGIRTSYEPRTLRKDLCGHLFVCRGTTWNLKKFGKTQEILIDTFAQKYGLHELVCLRDAARSHLWWFTKPILGSYHESHDLDHGPLLVPLNQLNTCYFGKTLAYIEQKIQSMQASQQDKRTLTQRLSCLINRYYTAPVADGRWSYVRDNWVLPVIAKAAGSWLLSVALQKGIEQQGVALPLLTAAACVSVSPVAPLVTFTACCLVCSRIFYRPLAAAAFVPLAILQPYLLRCSPSL